MKTQASKVGYYSKSAEIVSTALTTQSSQRQQKYMIHFSVYSTWDVQLCMSPEPRAENVA